MTACVNRKHTKKVAAVVTASLVGALSLGVAPVAAMANTEIDLLVDDDVTIKNADVTYDGEDRATFTYNGKAQGIVAETLTPEGGSDPQKLELLPKLTGRSAGYYYYYVAVGGSNAIVSNDGTAVQYKNANGKTVDLKGTNCTDGAGNFVTPSAPGEYAVVVGYWENGDWTYVTTARSFKIVGQSLEDATLFEGDDVTDTTFTFTGKLGSTVPSTFLKNVGVAIDGVQLDKGDYKLSIINPSNGAALVDGPDYVNPGTYVVKIEGRKAYAGQSVEKELTFGMLDLDDAVIVGKTVTSAPTATGQTVRTSMVSINDIAAADFFTNPEYTIDYVSSPSGVAYKDEKGAYTFKITAKPDSKLVTGSKEFTVLNADFVASIKYDGATMPAEYKVDLSKDKPSYFDLDEIAVAYSNATGKTVELDPEDYTVTVTDDEGNTDCDLTQPGTYYVKVDVNYKNENGKVIAGSASTKVVVSYGTVTQAANVYFTFDGKNVASRTDAEYTGEDFTEKMSIEVVKGSKTFEEGTDYTVTITKKQSDGKWAEVDSIVDAGEYRITVEGETYNGTATFDFEVTPMTPAYAMVDYDVVTDSDSNSGILAYTGEVLTPTYTFYNSDDEKLDVPADAYVVESYDLLKKDGTVDKKDVELKDAGEYVAHIVSAKDADNYDIDVDVKPILVSKDKVFLDVPSGMWYSQSVYSAAKLQYMNGYAGTQLFGAEDSIKRGDVAVVLFNMAGGSKYNPVDDKYSETTGYDTGFDDVDGKMYYAQAIAWAKEMGIVNGDAGTKNFRPEDTVTAEEFAAMLANYASKQGDDVDGAEADLAGYTDADQVSEWAKQSIEWAVANDVMGNDTKLAPKETIKRARVAAMVVNYQPDGATSGLLGGLNRQ